MITIVIPALNEAASIGGLVTALKLIEGDKEIIVVDGASHDGTAALAVAAGARVVEAPRGRGQQLRAGAELAGGDVLWFLHADSSPAPESLHAIESALADASVVAGNFALTFAGDSRAARHLNWVYPKLRRLGLSYGDAGIFVRRSVYQQAGGFGPHALFEDLDLVRRLRPLGRFVHLDCPLTTSPRRFAGRSYGLVWAQWIALQSLYWLGVSPATLARWYRPVR